MNLSTIAKKANVSVSTVSKAFSDSREISEETRENILNIAKELGVYDKYYKGKYNRRIIAVIAPELKSQLYYAIISELNEIFDRMGCTLSISVYNFDKNIQAELIRYYATFGHSDGIIVIGNPLPVEIEIEVPVIVIGNDNKQFDCVAQDSSEAMNEAIRHLKDNGHRRIGFIGEGLTTAKLSLFREAMFRNCIPVNEEWIITSDERFEAAGYSGMNHLFELAERPTAIVAAYDYIALGIYRSIYEHGYMVPDDVSVIGMDNIDVIRNVHPPMTSIGVNPKELCGVVAALMMKKLENRYYRLDEILVFKSKLSIRESVKKIN